MSKKKPRTDARAAEVNRAEAPARRHTERIRELQRDLQSGIVVAMAFIALGLLIEPTSIGRKLQTLTYHQLHARLPGRCDDVVIADITGIPVRSRTPDTDAVTVRAHLIEVLEAILQQGPRAVAIDMDLAPNLGHPIDPSDPEVFEICSTARVLLGVDRTRDMSPAEWLGHERFAEIAVNIKADRMDNRLMPRSYKRTESNAELPSLAWQLASTFLDQKVQLPSNLLLTSVVYESHAGMLDEYLVDFSPVDRMVQERVVLSSVDDVHKAAWQGSPFLGRAVILGKADPDNIVENSFVPPGRSVAVPGVYLHASAANTLIQGPLRQPTPLGRVLLDGIATAMMFAFVFGVRRIYILTPSKLRIQRAHLAASITAVMIVVTVAFWFARSARIVWDGYPFVVVALLLHPFGEHAVRALSSLWHRFFFGERARPKTAEAVPWGSSTIVLAVVICVLTAWHSLVPHAPPMGSPAYDSAPTAGATVMVEDGSNLELESDYDAFRFDAEPLKVELIHPVEKHVAAQEHFVELPPHAPELANEEGGAHSDSGPVPVLVDPEGEDCSVHLVGDRVLNGFGFPVRAITRNIGTQVFAEAYETSEAKTIGQFQFLYLLPPHPADSPESANLETLAINGFCRVARDASEKEFLGWVREEDLQRWDHVQALGFTELAGRDPVLFFSSEQDLERYLETRDASLAGWREPANRGDNLILMPLLDATRRFWNGEEQGVYKVAFLAGPAPFVAREPGIRSVNEASVPTVDDLVKNASLDIVFVVDTTGSMQPGIDQVLKSVEAVAKALEESPRKIKLRLGLVGYRDSHIPQLGYTAQIFCDLEKGEDIGFFLEKLRTMKAAEHGSAGWAEDVWAGVDLALDPRMNWNDARSAWPIIALVGDASAHGIDDAQNSTGHTANSIMLKAQPLSSPQGGPRPKTFFVQHILDPQATADRPVAREQFIALTTGAVFPGEYAQCGRGEDFSEALTERILEKLGAFEALVQSELEPTAASPEKSEIEPPTVAELAATGMPSFLLEEFEQAREAGRAANKAQGIQFSQAYATEFGVDGKRQFVPCVLVSKGRLELFRSMLGTLVQLFEFGGVPGSRDVQFILDNLRSMCATLNLGLEISSDLSVGQILNAAVALPLKPDVFTHSIASLALMGTADWQSWIQRVQEVEKSLDVILSSPSIWWPLQEGAEPRHHCAFVRLSDLP